MILFSPSQLSNALAHCHRLDVKHGDIKSNNVKFNKHTGNYMLLDFGLAMLSDEERRTSLRHAGAIEFMAPEQNEGKMFFGTDVYSFGIVLFEMLAGRVPFPLDGNSETARNKVMVAHMEATPPDLLSLRASMLPPGWPEEKKALEMQVPEWLLNLIGKCLQKRPEDRFANGEDLHEFITHHRLFTAEVAGLVRTEDSRWQSAMAEKNYEVQDLKAIVARQDRELEELRRQPVLDTDGGTERKTVSRSAFATVLTLLFLATGLAVYGWVFHRSAVAGTNTTATESYPAGDTASATREQITSVVSENKSAAKRQLKEQKKKQAADSVAKDGTEKQSTDEGLPEDAATDEKKTPEETTPVNPEKAVEKFLKEKPAKKDTTVHDQAADRR